MSSLPAPYESAQQDDLGAALSAALTVTTALITAWVIGNEAYVVIAEGIDLLRNGASSAEKDAFVESLQETAVPTAGWALGAIFLVVGALLLLLRRGRGTVIIGALLAIGTTAFAQFGAGYGDATAAHPVEGWPLFWGGAVVLGLALLPAIGRWVGKRRQSASTNVIGTTDTGAILWPGT
jgi:hypothetical protein